MSPWYQLVAGRGGTYRSPGFFQLLSPRWSRCTSCVLRRGHRCLEWSGGAGEVARAGDRIAVGGVGAASGFVVLFGVVGRQFRRQAEQNARLGETAEALRASEAESGTSPKCRPTGIGAGRGFAVHLDLRHFLAGYRRDHEYRGKTPWEQANGDLNTPLWRDHKRELHARLPFRNLRYRRRGHDGTPRNVSISGNPVFDVSGAFLGYRGTGRDITAEVEAEVELLRRQGTRRDGEPRQV